MENRDYRKRRLMTASALLLLAGPFLAGLFAEGSSQAPSGAAPATLIAVRPSYEMALGSSTQYFGGGGGVRVDVNRSLRGLPVYLLGGVDYSFLSTSVSQSVSVATALGGAGLKIPLGSTLNAFAYGSAGYYFGTLNDFSLHATDPYLGGGGGIELALSSTFALRLGVQYDAYLGLYQGLSFGVSSVFGRRARAAAPAPVESAPAPPQPVPLSVSSPVTITQVDLHPIFPVLYSHYADHPIGELVVKNETGVPVTNLQVKLFAQEYMNNPTETSVSGTLAPGKSMKIAPDALFTQSVLDITEGTKSSGDLTVSYDVGGRPATTQKVVVLNFVGRNGMTWSDTRRAAAFVTAQDPAVLLFARSVASYVQSKETRPINQALEMATAFHDELALYGINYIVNPVTPYAQVSNEPNVVDYLQFPVETIQYKSGDCSDLSILYSALLESVGIPTAFITIPGHIFVAVDTGLTPAEATAALMPLDSLIERGGKEWIPVEVTSIHGGFLKAWRLGANEWYQNELLHQAGFYPVEAAWKVYQPVGLPGSEPNITPPATSAVFASYSKDVQGFIDLAIKPQIAQLQGEIEQTGSVHPMNNLGILYAKWGQMDQAEKEFKAILAKASYLPAILNLGNIYYLKSDWTNALVYYNQAQSIDPNDPNVLLSIAKANAELENFGTAKASYAKLQQVDPQLAEAYSYLGQGPAGVATRSADVAQERRTVVWDGE